MNQTKVVCQNHISELLSVIHQTTTPLDISPLREPKVEGLCEFENEFDKLTPEINHHNRPVYAFTWKVDAR
jgi:hypothetical protein